MYEPAVSLPLLADAACTEYPTDLFFPPSGTDGREAKQICAECPSRAACLDWALEVREPFGVFGGMTAAERYRLLRKMRAA